MLIFSMGVSADGFIADREGGFEWTGPSDELFRFHLEQVRELGGYLGNARLAEASLAGEVAAALEATDKDVSIGGAGLAATAIELGLVDELRMFRYPVIVGGGTPFLPSVAEHIALHLVETRTFGAQVVYVRA
jgi:dihydrofolate reductase